MGAVDLQAFVALAAVFIAIVLHLFGKPFDVNKRNTRLLHHLEFGALTVCWFTFWGKFDFLFSWFVICKRFKTIYYIYVCIDMYYSFFFFFNISLTPHKLR